MYVRAKGIARVKYICFKLSRRKEFSGNGTILNIINLFVCNTIKCTRKFSAVNNNEQRKIPQKNVALK